MEKEIKLIAPVIDYNMFNKVIKNNYIDNGFMSTTLSKTVANKFAEKNGNRSVVTHMSKKTRICYIFKPVY